MLPRTPLITLMRFLLCGLCGRIILPCRQKKSEKLLAGFSLFGSKIYVVCGCVRCYLPELARMAPMMAPTTTPATMSSPVELLWWCC